MTLVLLFTTLVPYLWVKTDKFPVNSFGQVKFIENLVVADASIMPRLSSKPISVNAASLGDYIVNKNT